MNATATSSASAVSKNNGNIAIVCNSCGMDGHFRRAYRDCPMNPGVVGTFIEPPVITISASNSVTCPHCGRKGHSRRSHSNCAMNFTAQNRVSSLNIARDSALPEVQRNNVGSMDVICSSCGGPYVGVKKEEQHQYGYTYISSMLCSGSSKS